MKKVSYLFVAAIWAFTILFTANGLFAQSHKIPVQNTSDGKLILKDFLGDLPIEGYSGNEIIITGTSERSSGTPERAKGLKPIYSGGTDNTGMGLSVEKDGNQVKITCLIPFTQRQRGSYKIKVPENFSLKLHSGCERSNEVTVTNMKNEIEINNCHDITLKNVAGPLILSTISGSIDVSIQEIVKNKPLSITTISGAIEVRMPAQIAANVEMTTVTGGMYTDFDIPETKDQMKRIGGHRLDFKLNGGGTNLKLNTISGNIYLRKSKSNN
jgi:lia operon protein LiaG